MSAKAKRNSLISSSSAASMKKVTEHLSGSDLGSGSVSPPKGSSFKGTPAKFQKPEDDDLDDLDDLAGDMGDDFGFGFDDAQGDPNIKPKKIPVPESNPATRTSESLHFTWEPIGQVLEKLVVQVMPYNPKKSAFHDGFDLAKGTIISIPDPGSACSVVVPGLQSSTLYVARLVATNPAGTTEGPETPIPIETLEFAPPRGDISGFIVTVDAKASGSTLGRRLSFKKDGPTRSWYVLDGMVLTWFDKVDGKEQGNVHMKDVDNIVSEDAVEGSTSIVVNLANKTAINMILRSGRPDVTNADYCKAWLTALRKAKSFVPSSFGSSSTTGMLF